MTSSPNLAGSSLEMVVLVDESDQEKGLCEKLRAHQEGLLHRAFSIFIFRTTFNGLELLLQKRAAQKYHSPGLWTNSCCGHPRKGEEVPDAAARRLKEELGFQVPLHYVDRFIYKIGVGSELVEHEFDHVFYGFMEKDMVIPFNPEEVQEISWVNVATLKTDLQENPALYTGWFSEALDIALLKLKPHLALQPTI